VRYTTRQQDQVFLRERFEDFLRPWKVGDEVRSGHRGYDIPTTTISSIEKDVVTMADGSSCHITLVRRPK